MTGQGQEGQVTALAQFRIHIDTATVGSGLRASGLDSTLHRPFLTGGSGCAAAGRSGLVRSGLVRSGLVDALSLIQPCLFRDHAMRWSWEVGNRLICAWRRSSDTAVSVGMEVKEEGPINEAETLIDARRVVRLGYGG